MFQMNISNKQIAFRSNNYSNNDNEVL